MNHRQGKLNVFVALDNVIFITSIIAFLGLTEPRHERINSTPVTLFAQFDYQKVSQLAAQREQ